MAIAFAVTGMSRAPTLVTDIQDGYFDRLCMTPVRRLALLLGLMAADVVVIVALCLPVLAIGFGIGVRFATGAPGVLAFIGFSALWGLAFTGFPYAVALKTGSPAAVNASFVLFFPLFFLSDAVVPKQVLTGWFSAIATYNPVTYLLAALRSLISGGWRGKGPRRRAVAALAGIGTLSMTLALLALRGRIRRGTETGKRTRKTTCRRVGMKTRDVTESSLRPESSASRRARHPPAGRRRLAD